MSVIDNDRLGEALGPVLAALAADGYLGQAELIGGRVRLDVLAGESACEECLTSKEVMGRVVQRSLEKAGMHLEVELRYPNDPR